MNTSSMMDVLLSLSSLSSFPLLLSFHSGFFLQDRGPPGTSLSLLLHADRQYPVLPWIIALFSFTISLYLYFC